MKLLSRFLSSLSAPEIPALILITLSIIGIERGADYLAAHRHQQDTRIVYLHYFDGN